MIYEYLYLGLSGMENDVNGRSPMTRVYVDTVVVREHTDRRGKKHRVERGSMVKVLFTHSESGEYGALLEALEKPLFVIEAGSWSNSRWALRSTLDCYKRIMPGTAKLLIIPLFRSDRSLPLVPDFAEVRMNSRKWHSRWLLMGNSYLATKDMPGGYIDPVMVENPASFSDQGYVDVPSTAAASDLDIARAIGKSPGRITIISGRTFGNEADLYQQKSKEAS